MRTGVRGPEGGIVAKLADGVVLGDGGYVLELERRGYVRAGPFTPEVVVEFPDAVAQLHREFLRAGAEVLQALTFYAGAEKLAASGCASSVAAINRAALRIAKSVAGDDALVAGTLTLTPGFVCGDRAARERARATMTEQVAWQHEAEVDFVVGETFVTLEEALIALEAIRAFALPAMITMNIGPAGSADGFPVEECAKRLAAAGADVVGVNCAFDPDVLLSVAERMRAATNAYVACQPVGYRTLNPSVPFTAQAEFPLALEPTQLTRFELAQFARRARDAGVNYVGGCCGVVAHHVRAMAEALGRRPPASLKSPRLESHVIPSVGERAGEDYWHRLTSEWRES